MLCYIVLHLLTLLSTLCAQFSHSLVIYLGSEMNYLSDYEVCQILYFSGKISRLRSAGKKVEKEYASKQRKQVQQLFESSVNV